MNNNSLTYSAAIHINRVLDGREKASDLVLALLFVFAQAVIIGALLATSTDITVTSKIVSVSAYALIAIVCSVRIISCIRDIRKKGIR